MPERPAAEARVQLLLGEMFAPAIAAALRDKGHDVIAVAEHDALRALAVEEIYRWAGEHRRRIVTENVKDCRPLLRRAEESGRLAAPVLFTSSRSFPRSRRNPGPLIHTLDAWLRAAEVGPRSGTDWLPGSA